MSARTVAKEQAIAAASTDLGRALRRLVRAEASGTLTPREAEVVARLRAIQVQDSELSAMAADRPVAAAA